MNTAQIKENDNQWEGNPEILLKKIDKLFLKHDTFISAICARWGFQAEESFRNALKGILEDSFGVQVKNITEYDNEGYVFGSPDQIEIDIIIKNGMLIICEIKSSMSRGDVYIFGRKISFYEKNHNCKADRKIIISPMVDKYARSVAEKLNMEVYTYADDVHNL